MSLNGGFVDADQADLPGDEEDVLPEPPMKGLAEAGKRLLKWLNDIVDDPDFQSAIPLSLVRIHINTQEEVLLEVRHDLDKAPPETVGDLLDAAVNEASRAFSGGLERADFSVKVEGKGQRLGFTLVTPNPMSLALSRVGDRHSRYAPDLEGITSQGLDVQLALIEHVVDQSTSNLRDKNQTIATLREELRLSRESEWRYRKEIERLMDGSMRRTMMMEEFKRDQDRKDMYAEGFMNIAPPVVATVLGPEAGKVAALLAAFKSDGGGGLSKLLGGALGGAGVDPSAFGGGGPGDADEEGPDPMFFAMAVETCGHVDAFIEVLEKRKGVFQKLLQLLAPAAPECVSHLQALHNGSMARRAAKTAAAPAHSPPSAPHPPAAPPNRPTAPSQRR